MRQVRLDVVGMDREGTVYYAEMQQRNTGNLIRRSRYYQVQLDVSLVEPGSTDFNLLNESCFILIAPFDIFGRGLYRYTFEETCRECPDLKLEDGALRVFINTKGTNRQDFSKDLSRCISSGDTSKERSVCESLDFMEYIGETTEGTAKNADSERIRRIHKKIERIRKSEKAGLKYMQRWEELAYEREDGRKEGKAEGLAEGLEAGRAEGLAERKFVAIIEAVCKKRKKNKPAEIMADELEEELPVIENIIRI